MKLWPYPRGIPEPDRMEITWIVREEVSVALDISPDGKLVTSVYYYEKTIGPSADLHTELDAAFREVGRLLDGGWRDYFEEQTLVRFDAEKEAP